jgi:post-segregation antitoxin (ccd killing protein)
LGSYVTVSTKVRRKVVEKAMKLGINVSGFLQRKLKEKVEGGGGVYYCEA